MNVSKVRVELNKDYEHVWLNVNEASIFLRISRCTVYRMAKAGKIPCVRIGRLWRFNIEELDNWRKEGALAGTR